jgi:hypothetical protein
MQEIIGSIWDFHKQGHWVIVPTNGNRTKDGLAVMGAGVAKDAALRYPELMELLGEALAGGNGVNVFPDQRIITFPTKNNWRNPSDVMLIHRSCQEFKRIIENWQGECPAFYSPQLGCGLGGLKWEMVKPILEKYLNDWVIIVNLPRRA